MSAKITTLPQLKEYYSIGKIVKAYIGYDKVLDFFDHGHGCWSVKVQECDINGNTMENPRWHSTWPTSHQIAQTKMLVQPA